MRKSGHDTDVKLFLATIQKQLNTSKNVQIIWL